METHPPMGHPVSRRVLLGGMVAGTAVLFTGCSFGESGGSSKSGKSQTLTRAVSNPIDSLDPHYINAGSYVTPSGLLEGLVLQDETGKNVVPAIAEKWDTSGDGLTYTFHIRPEAKFSNGDSISAKDFEWTYKRLLTPTGAGGGNTVGANSYKPSLGITGAQDHLAGTLTDWSKVGVRATDDKTLVITLESPNSAFLMGLTHVSMMLLHPPSVQKSATGWMKPANWVGSGPFVPTSWVPTASMSMKPHEHYWDRKNVHLDQVDVKVIGDSSAQLLAYRNNGVDVVDVGDGLISLYNTDTTLMGQTQLAKGYSVHFYQTMFSKHPASRDVRVRQALSLAIDRDKLAKIMPGTEPGLSLIPASVPGWDKSITTAFDPEKAKSLLAVAGYPGGRGMPTIQFLDFMGRPLTDAVADMWQSILGVTIKRNIVDRGLMADTRYKPIADSNMMGFSYSAFGGLPNLNSWVIDLWGPDVISKFSLPAGQAGQYLAIQGKESLSGAEKAKQLAALVDQYATPEAKKFAADATAAKAMTDAGQRTVAFLRAAKMREDLCYEIPLVWGASADLVKPSVQGLHVQYTVHGFYYKGITKTN